jgi:hypothetical protein
MALNQYLTLAANGIKQFVTAISSSAGAADASKLISTNAAGKLDTTFLPAGVGISTITVLASEAIAAGNFVNIYNNAGTLNVRKADNSAAAKYANGFVLAAIASGGSGTVYLEGSNTALSGLTPGTRYYLGAGGAATTTPPALTATGSIIQDLGNSTNATTILFEYNEAIEIV